MAYKVLSDVIIINKDLCKDNHMLEKELQKRYSDIIRWAIVAMSDNNCKVSISYRTDV